MENLLHSKPPVEEHIAGRTGATTDSIVVTPSTNMTYNVTVTNGCTANASTSIKVFNPNLAPCCDTVIQLGNSTHLSANGFSVTHYVWTPNTGINCDTCPNVTVSPTITTTYTVTGTDSAGCSIERIVLVVVEQPCSSFVIPNVFTPNNPGPLAENSVFYINTISLSSWTINIFDRWGKEVYSSTDLNKYWDGKTKGGGAAPDGIYYYVINANCDGTVTKKEGFVQLIR